MVLPLLVKLVELLTGCNEKASQSVNKFKRRKVYWSVYIRFIIEFFLELSLISFIRCKGMNFNSKPDSFLSMYAMVQLAILVISTAGAVVFLRKSFDSQQFDDTSFKESYESLPCWFPDVLLEPAASEVPRNK